MARRSSLGRIFGLTKKNRMSRRRSRRNGTKKGMRRKTARRAYMNKAKKKAPPRNAKGQFIRLRRVSHRSSSKKKLTKKQVQAKRRQLRAAHRGVVHRVTRLAKKNGLALKNPTFAGLVPYLTGYALPVVIAGGAAGAIHAYANLGPMQITSKISDAVARIPGIGEPLATNAPNTIQGILVGTVLALVASRLKGQAKKYVALTGGSVVAIGAGMDAYNAVAARTSGGDLAGLALDNMGGLALDNLGGLALDNMGGIALDNAGQALDNAMHMNPGHYGDGMAFETAPLSAQEYDQATLADAYYSGADFSLGEGTALLNGTWRARFGAPSKRTKRVSGGASHFAGQPGHRWGWLIKVVGQRKAAQIAALKPKKRLEVIKSLRAGAIQGYKQSMLLERARQVQATTPSPEEFAAQTVAAGSPAVCPGAPEGPIGPAGSNAYGAALFMGA